MSKRETVVVHQKHGPVTYTLVACDECREELQPEHMVGWFRLEAQGVLAPTYGNPLIPLDFCGLSCLYSAVTQMNGGTPSKSSS